MNRTISNSSAGLMTMSVFGLQDLQRQLLELGAVAGAKVLAKAARKALTPVLNDAKARVPVDTGLLRDSLAITVKKPSKGPAVLVAGLKIKVGKGGARGDIRKAIEGIHDSRKRKKTRRKVARNSAHWRWHFVEFGTRDQAAQPFIRPAFEGRWRETVELLRTELAKEIARHLKREAKKARAA